MRRTGKKQFLGILVFLAAVSYVTGCSGIDKDRQAEKAGVEPEATIRFAWWGTKERADRTIQAVRLFEEKNPQIQVKTSWFEFDEYEENLRIAASVDNMPDVFQGYVSSDNYYLEQGLIEDLSGYVQEGLIRTSDISQELLETGMYNGALYGLSMGCNVKCLVLDEEVYEKAGLAIPEICYPTWEALEEDLYALKNVTGAYGAEDLFDQSFTLRYFLRQHGESMFTEVPGQIGFTEKTLEEFYQLKKRWIEEKLIPAYDAAASTSLSNCEFVKGNAAVKACYSNEYLQLKELTGKELRLILMPGAQNGLGTDLRPGHHISMAAHSNEKEAAAKLIDFLINDVEANKILDAERGIPVSASVRQAMEEDKDEQQEMWKIIDLAEQYSAVQDAPSELDTYSFDRFMRAIEEEIMYDQFSIEEAYEKIRDYISKGYSRVSVSKSDE